MFEKITDSISDAARKNNSTPYWVGGLVRDGLLGRPCHDWDLVCKNALKVSRTVARRLKVKLITLDEQFKIYRIVLKNASEAGRPVTVDFAELSGGTLEKDLGRRDFSVNAMAVQVGKEIVPRHLVDPFRGAKDLRTKTLRALSQKAFLDDPLRLLRAYRLSADLTFRVAPLTRKWIRQAVKRIQAANRNSDLYAPVLPSAPERIREELLKLFSTASSVNSVRAMDEDGVLTMLFPALEASRRTAIDFYGRGGVMKHVLATIEGIEWLLAQLEPSVARARTGYLPPKTVQEPLAAYLHEPVAGYPRYALMKWGGLLHDVGKPATAQRINGRMRFFGHEDVGADMTRKIAKAFRLSRQERHLLTDWVQHHMRPGNLAAGKVLTDKAIARFFRDLRGEGVAQLLVSLGDHYTYLSPKVWGTGKDRVEKTVRRMLDQHYHHAEKVNPPKLIDGNQIMKRFKLKPGPIIGEWLEAVRDAQTEGRVKTTADAFEYLKNNKRIHKR